jgi:hypothetical protein
MVLKTRCKVDKIKYNRTRIIILNYRTYRLKIDVSWHDMPEHFGRSIAFNR